MKYTSPKRNFLSHHREVVSSTPSHGQTSYHFIVTLYRVHITTNKLIITL